MPMKWNLRRRDKIKLKNDAPVPLLIPSVTWEPQIPLQGEKMQLSLCFGTAKAKTKVV